MDSLSAGGWVPSCTAVISRANPGSFALEGPLSRAWEAFCATLRIQDEKGLGVFHRPWHGTPATPALLEAVLLSGLRIRSDLEALTSPS